ncbi:hypothetical protein SAMN05444008_102423 [Cnuella takakiae]|uniref:Uncharacterized protein n=1 Tax=Cnuella takakiae TaxID=1302690 RepID=A0A1M4VYY4_9BACT|nr:hypothetical protein [Cnuella takakiae]OLY92464.1 hypothetical protein BUE76_11635 [Cnuella takakiae]SHE73922.1 hypothetical protein SAMN05444008_102423 [Cnuella takakiae]
MNQYTRLEFGLQDYEKFQEVYTLLYHKIYTGENLEALVSEIEIGIINLNDQKEQAGGQTNAWIEGVKEDLVYLKRLVHERIEYLNKKQQVE